MEQGQLDFIETNLITEERVISPLTQVLNNVIPQEGKPQLPKPEQSESFAKSIGDLFPEQQYDEKAIQNAKKILGNITNELAANELKDTVVKMLYLTETWLDEFEKEIFKDRTLNELLHEKGGL